MTTVDHDHGTPQPAQPAVPPSPPTPDPAQQGGGTPGWLRALRLVGVLACIAVAFVVGTHFGGGGPEPAGHSDGHATQGTTWTCSMHPQVQQPEPGLCPICGMDLIPMTPNGVGGAAAPQEVMLSERARVLARVQTAPVGRAEAPTRDIQLLGRLDVDETRVRTVTAWTEGRIDKLLVATTGQTIKRGQNIATLYSPEIYTAHQDLLTARRQLDRLGDATPTARRSAEITLQSARQRLSLLGVPRADLDRMEAADAPWTQVRISTPFGGTVLERLVNEGNYVMTGAGLYKLVDLTTLWVQLDAYESDVDQIAVGQPVELTVEALPGERFEGVVAFVDPILNSVTRTTRVRVEVRNEAGELRPGMFAEAVVKTAGSDLAPLVIPETAPLFTGRRSIVYVELPGREAPTFEAREVRLGHKASGVYPVVAGLIEGERIVVHGAFRIDADLQLRGGQSMMMGGDDFATGRFDHALEVPPEFVKTLAPLIEAYLDLQDALASDDFDRARQAAANTRTALDTIEAPRQPDVANAWREARSRLLSDLRYLDAATSLAGARREFEPLTLSVEMVLQHFGNPLPEELHVAWCPMAFDNRGARWLQRGSQVRNAYFGSEMLACGELKESVAPGAHLGLDQPLPPPRPVEDDGPKAVPVAPLPGPSPKAPASAPASQASSQPQAMPASAPTSAPAGGPR